MPFPLDPTFQTTGAPYLTVADGTTAPNNAGDPVDLTNTQITVAPETNGVQDGTEGTITNFGEGLLEVSGLHDMAPTSVGRFLTIDGNNLGNRGTFEIVSFVNRSTVVVSDATGVFPDVNGGTAATITGFSSNTLDVGGLVGLSDADVGRELTLSGASHAGNNGTFTILQVTSPTSCRVFDKTGVYPDANTGAITWSENTVPFEWSEAVNPEQFAPGDPLTYLAEQATLFHNTQRTTSPARSNVSPLLPPNINVPPGGELGANSLPELVGKFGQLSPDVPPGTVLPGTGATVGDVVVNDPQNPTHFEPTTFFDVNRDPTSLAFGQAPIMSDGPAVRAPSSVVAVPDPAVSAEKFRSGAILYPTSNPVVFSRS